MEGSAGREKTSTQMLEGMTATNNLLHMYKAWTPAKQLQ